MIEYIYIERGLTVFEYDFSSNIVFTKIRNEI